MKIIDKIHQAQREDRFFWSFEYFPPKTSVGLHNLYERIERMQTLGPEFIDVTWGAGGSTAELTVDIVTTAQSVYGLETMMHLTCTNMSLDKIDTALKAAKEGGCRNILALRGDPPKDRSPGARGEDALEHAEDLVRYIRKSYGDYFCIAVAGHPEGHPDNPDRQDDLRRLRDKVNAGADFVITQLFFDPCFYIDFVKRCREIGIDCPILPGIFPIQNYHGLQRIVALNQNHVPQRIWDALEPIKNDDYLVKEYGVDLAVRFIEELRETGIPGFHIFTFNLEKSSRLILEKLRLVPLLEERGTSFWKSVICDNAAHHNVWMNKIQHYRQIESWDEFPNGRWGNASSAAFGEQESGWGVSLKYSPEQCRMWWGEPYRIDDVAVLFARYCQGSLHMTPWSQESLAAESDTIRQRLAALNLLGYLTINSQPAVNGAKSDDPRYGWGPKDGYVYQKAYLEFFVSPSMLDKLIDKIKMSPSSFTYYAVNQQGDWRRNTKTETPNVVTWGIFPGKEVIQPTMVDATAFDTWKDEAFALWHEWAQIYDRQSASYQLLNTIGNEWYLMNIVHNDFPNTKGIWDLFDFEIDGIIAQKLHELKEEHLL
ncbi:methylenetetrahydrofolate reductase-domain-containing protein [Radiomyces spectabilis]|uniref:methylenetetrahydrofolate reductase-domain-containing protein n=1 Tax=Radiomyces spectabilis TaxID=64574 RepID=UPI002220991C|nr:methylenetetrahydrofolate reductase-domain-containing protein [Radiomyces spectabilis]KAI8365379.1 methylenetetrahydrofolate reductase-domain-containing protein [Radiomyces spectabilis]